MYKVSNTEKQIFQESRLLTDITERDLRSALSIDETFYDIPPFMVDTTQDIDYSTDTSWIEDETSFSIAPYPFIGTSTSISMFSVAEVPLGTVKGLRQGIFHIDYNYQKKALYRQADEITGDISEDEDLVHRILSFQINYGYGKDDKWYWVDKWDSRKDNYRYPKDADTEDSLFDVNRRKPLRIYPDNLPDAVRFRMRLQEVDNPKSPGREFEWVCDLPAAKPTEKKQSNE